MKELKPKKSLSKSNFTNLTLLFLLLCIIGCTDETSDNKIVETPNPLVEILAEEVVLLDTIPQAQDTIQYTKNADGYIELTWKQLEEVDFVERYTEEIETYVPYPVFRPSVQRLAGQKVEIKGYVIPVEETGQESIIVLSANPFSSCFFCGMAGPETIMDIKLVKKFKNKFKQDDIITFRGTMRLNDSDLYYLNYILEGAELAL